MNVHPPARLYSLSPPYSVAPSGGGVALLLRGGAVHLVVLHAGRSYDVDLDVRAEDRAQIFADVARYGRVVDLAGGKSGCRFGVESRKDRRFRPFSGDEGGSQSSFLKWRRTQVADSKQTRCLQDQHIMSETIPKRKGMGSTSLL